MSETRDMSWGKFWVQTEVYRSRVKQKKKTAGKNVQQRLQQKMHANIV